MPCPVHMLGDLAPFERKFAIGAARVECGGLPPLYAARACPGVLHAFPDASDRAGQASPEDGGSKLPHSTWPEAALQWATYCLRMPRGAGPESRCRFKMS